MLSRDAKTPTRRSSTRAACPTHTPTSSPLARNSPPPELPCSGVWVVIRNSPFSMTVVQLECDSLDQSSGPARELGTQIDPD